MTIGILSWGAHKTLTNTLTSYEKYGLWDKERIIFFQERSTEDINIATRFGYESMGINKNIGIGPAIRRLAEEATGELFLFLENDWELVEPASNTIAQATVFLGSYVADVVRLRHRQNPGHPLWTRQFAGNEYARPTHLLDCIHWVEEPEKYISEIQKLGDWYFTTSKNANYTNNPCMYRTEFLRENILPHIAQDMGFERDIQPFWEQQSFRIAQGRGLFTHNRID
jgi:hypothetical protein